MFNDFKNYIKYLHPPVRCPSAPPYEAPVFSAGDVQTVSSFSSEGQKHRSLTKQSHRTDIMRSDTMRTDDHRTEEGSEQSFHRDKVPWMGENSCLYPSLSLLRTDSQVRQSSLNIYVFESQMFRSRLSPIWPEPACKHPVQFRVQIHIHWFIHQNSSNIKFTSVDFFIILSLNLIFNM